MVFKTVLLIYSPNSTNILLVLCIDRAKGLKLVPHKDQFCQFCGGPFKTNAKMFVVINTKHHFIPVKKLIWKLNYKPFIEKTEKGTIRYKYTKNYRSSKNRKTKQSMNKRKNIQIECLTLSFHFLSNTAFDQ